MNRQTYLGLVDAANGLHKDLIEVTQIQRVAMATGVYQLINMELGNGNQLQQIKNKLICWLTVDANYVLGR